jgi:hypothetical protein
VSQPAFSPAVEAALDRYTISALPAGFSDRLLARLAAGDLPTAAHDVAAPEPRRRAKGFSGPWARSGRILGSTVLFGLVTAAAAASGLLGDPVYIPGVSEVLAKAEIIAPIEAKQASATKSVDKQLAATSTTETAEIPPATGKEAVKALVTQLRSDPEYRALPRKERVAIARAEAIELVRSGTVTGPELRQAIREMRAEARPIIRAHVQEVVARRRAETTMERAPERLKPEASEPVQALQPQPDNVAVEPEAPKLAADTVTAEPAPAEEPAATREERIEDLRERYKTATPEQRARIRQRIRERTAQRGAAKPVRQRP